MNFHQRIVAVFHRELTRIWHFKAYLAVLTILPVISLCFFAYIFREGITHNLPIALLDMDKTPLSRKLANMIDAAPEVEIRYSVSSAEDGKRLIREGRAHALLLIPEAFEAGILSLTPTNFEAYISGSNILINGLTSKSLLTTATTFSKGIQIQMLQQQGLSAESAMAMVMPVNFSKHIMFNPYTNYSYYLSPSFMPMMLLIFTLLSTIFAIGSELRYASADKWIAAAEDSFLVALAGKLLPTFLAMVFYLFAMFFLLFYIIGVPLNGSFIILAFGGVVFLLSYIAIGITLIALTADMRLALSLGGGYAVMAFSFSGLTFPLIAMHKSIQFFSHIFPFSYVTDIVIDQALRGAPISRSLYNICYIMIFWLLPIVSYNRLKRVCQQQKYWYKS